MDFYRGYVLTSGKVPREKYKGVTNLRTYEECLKHVSFAGVMAEDSVFVDFDNAEQAKIAYKIITALKIRCRILKTSRGLHFLFKNTKQKLGSCKTKSPLAIGLSADIKGGFTNSTEVLKLNGVLREIIYDTKEPYDEIPVFFLPVRSNIRDFNTLGTGDGRNDTLFKYILTLKANGYQKDEIINIYQLINDYVLRDPLPYDELNKNILRDEAFDKPVELVGEHEQSEFFHKDKFLFDKFAAHIYKKYHIKNINGALHIYKDNYYQSNYRFIEKAMLQEISLLSNSRRKEVLSYLESVLSESTEKTNCNYICFNNGIYDIEHDELLEHSPEYILTNKIPHNYKETHSNIVEQIMKNISCNNDKLIQLLYEMVGATMYARNEFSKAFILVGQGANGKSTFLTMVKNMLGEKNISSLDLNKLDDRFSTIMLYNKLANISDDMSDNFVPDMATFKKVVTGETINAEQKGQPKIDFNPYCKILLSANNIPRMGKGRDTYAISRRLIIVPFNAHFTAESNDFNQFISDDLKSEEAIEHLIYHSIKAIKRVLANKCRFTEVDEVRDKMVKFQQDNNPILLFFNEIDDIADRTTEDVYLQYGVFCNENNYQKLTKNIFIKECLKKFTDVEVKQKGERGNVKRTFVRKPDKTLFDL